MKPPREYLAYGQEICTHGFYVCYRCRLKLVRKAMEDTREACARVVFDEERDHAKFNTLARVEISREIRALKVPR